MFDFAVLLGCCSIARVEQAHCRLSGYLIKLSLDLGFGVLNSWCLVGKTKVRCIGRRSVTAVAAIGVATGLRAD